MEVSTTIGAAGLLSRLWSMFRRGHEAPIATRVLISEGMKDLVRIEMNASEPVLLDGYVRYAPRRWRSRMLSRLRLRSPWFKTTFEPPISAGLARGEQSFVVLKDRGAPRKFSASKQLILAIQKKNLIDAETKELRVQAKVLLHGTCKRCEVSFDLPNQS